MLHAKFEFEGLHETGSSRDGSKDEAVDKAQGSSTLRKRKWSRTTERRIMLLIEPVNAYHR
ncbi:hypothetical protein M407DRAFT_241998 [Tulasnella calospora MUT 4182]|uniref:Uncharacterized protein n=1 Tax=Tulasnella calospora MUT 4182 TaxID=1051891 RepID=A0A0C3QSE8_9AGAM|nr:hypothetical protein M407DRAFT_241998 [Tulasnella calospora MUT 4182]